MNLFSFFMFSIIFESLKSKSTQMLRPQTGNSRVSFNDTLLNFGLWGAGSELPLCVYTWNSLLIKIVKRLWPIHTVQISNMQYACGVQVYGEVLYVEFYSVSSEQFINDEILLCKRL